MSLRHSAVGPACWALRSYLWPALWLAAAGALALAVALPVMTGATRLTARTVPPSDLGIEWTTLAVPPPVTQQRAVTRLSGLASDLAVTVLGVAVVTIITLSLARGAARRNELALRRAVGAMRRDLETAALTEGIVIAALAVGLGVPVGLFGARTALAAWPGSAAAAPLGPGWLAVAGIAGVIVAGALLPALGATLGRRRIAPAAMPQDLVVPALQLGISLALLAAASQLAAASELRAPGARGPQPDGEVYGITVDGSPAARAAYLSALLRRLAAQRRFDVVSVASAGTLVGLGTEDLVVTDCGRCFQGGLPLPLHPVPAVLHAVSPDTFRALGVPLVAGRTFTIADDWRATRVTVIDETLASRHFEAGAAVGRKVYLGRDGWYTVIGVVRRRQRAGFGAELISPHTVYVSVAQNAPDAAELLLRPRRARAGPPRVPVSLGPGRSAGPARSESGVLAAEAAPLRWFGRLFRFEGAIGFVIAAIGTFAIMRLWVQAALIELAVRRLTGAKRRHVVRFVLIRAAAAGLAGVAIGLWLQIMVSGLLSEIVGTRSAPPASLARLAAILLAAALAGAWLPAWRAARLTPAALVGATDA